MTSQLTYRDFDPETEGRREVLCALGNGNFVTRGAASWAAEGPVHYPGTYFAGGYNRATSQLGGRDIENEDLVNVANWIPISFRIDEGEWFDLEQVDIIDYRQDLHLERGVLEWHIRCSDAEGRVVTIVEERLVHMGRPHLAAQRFTVEIDSTVDRLELRSGVDGHVANHGVERYCELEHHHVETLHADGSQDRVWIVNQTTSSHIDIAVGARVTTQGFDDGVERRVVAESGRAHIHDVGPLQAGRRLEVEKVIALHTTHDRPGYEPLADVQNSLDHAGDFDELLATHEAEWQRLWNRSELRLSAADEWADMVLQLHMFHMHQSYSSYSADLDAGIPARGWHGEAYRGHIFWDELFVLPFFDLRFPDRSRAALRYRRRRLPAARRAAAAEGHRGAMFPWQSGSTGREESQQWHLNPRSGRWNPDPTYRQRHIGIAIAHNAWHHWQVTGDDEFFYDVGADLLLSIADFFASLATWDPSRKRYEICGVIGPDEYHTSLPDADRPGLDNNAYTNVMAAWILARAIEAFGQLPELRRAELSNALHLDEDRIEEWHRVSHLLHVPFLDDGLIEQFEGYGDLEEFDWQGYRERYGDISRLDRILEAEGDTPNRYKASKQADTVMIFYLLSADELVALFDQLGYDFSADDIPRNVEYYLDRTSHGSTLSRVVHAWVQARSDRAASWECYRSALASDVDDIQDGTTAEGIHLGAMAGTVDLAQRCYSGLVIRNDTIYLNPRLPDEVEHLAFPIWFRTHWMVRVWIGHDSALVRCTSLRDESVRIALKGEVVDLAPGAEHRFDLVALKDG